MASSAPLAMASASPLSTRLTRKAQKIRVPLPRGTKAMIVISATIHTEVPTSSCFLPRTSARAPEGTSAQTIVIAHTVLSRENCSIDRP